MSPPLLRSPRLTGRPFTRADWPVFEAVIADPVGARWLAPGAEFDAEERAARARAAAERFSECWAAEGVGPYVWSIGAQPIGYAGLRRSELDRREAWEVLWGLRAEFRGRGYAREAAAAALAAEPGGLVLAWALPGNTASHKVMEALGFAFEGHADWRGFEHVVYRLER